MMKRKKRRLGALPAPIARTLMASTLMIVVAMVGVPSTSWSGDTYREQLETPVEASIDIRQQSQKDGDKWEAEKTRLQRELDTLTAKNRVLSDKVASLTQQKISQTDLNESLRVREVNSRKMEMEITPFLEDLLEKVATFVASDTPFLAEERNGRIARLKAVAKDPEVGPAERFRKIMEALFVEAEYGNTIEVYQEKIRLDGEDILGDVFRLGRVSLFFLSLDHKRAAYFQVAQMKWDLLDEAWIPAVVSAVEMGEKRRPIELLCLPVGRLVVK